MANLTEYVILETLKRSNVWGHDVPEEDQLIQLARELAVVVTLRIRSKEARAIVEERYKK